MTTGRKGRENIQKMNMALYEENDESIIYPPIPDIADINCSSPVSEETDLSMIMFRKEKEEARRRNLLQEQLYYNSKNVLQTSYHSSP